MTALDPPPFRIYLLRHAKAVGAAPALRDFDRDLDEQGYAEAELVADKAAERRYVPDLIISSTAARCRQTAEAVRRATLETLDTLFVDELYNGTTEIYLEILFAQRTSRSVMLIGHNPAIEQTLGLLVGPRSPAAVLPSGYPTAGLAVLDHQDAGPGGPSGWALVDFLKA